MAAAEPDRLVQRAVAGDEAAFAEVYARIQPALLRYLRVTAPAVAEDVAAETWLEVVRRLSQFEGGSAQLRSWVFAIARSKSVDQARYERRRPVEFTDDVGPLLPADPQDVEATVAEHDATAQALRLIASLPPHEAEVVALRVVAELDVAEVARLTGRSPGAVRVAAHRGLRRLAAQLGQAERHAAPLGSEPGGAP